MYTRVVGLLSIPVELICHILSYLELQDLLHCTEVRTYSVCPVILSKLETIHVDQQTYQKSHLGFVSSTVHYRVMHVWDGLRPPAIKRPSFGYAS